MVEREVAFVKVQPRKSGSFMVTIPSEVAKELDITNGERLKVVLDKERKRIIYEKV